MSDPVTLHFILGAALLLPGVWLIRHRRAVLGWTLAALGMTVGLIGVMVPTLH